MPDLADIFAHLCGRGRCFTIDGASLPVCQRCLGLYLGAAVTAAWALGWRLWRQGLPQRTVLGGQIAAILLAMLGGVHVIDPGPAWRLTCGLWTGHVAVLWLLGGAGDLWRAGNGAATAAGWSRPQRWQGWAWLLALPLLAMAFSRWATTGRAAWTGLAALGVVALGLAIAVALAAVGWWAMRRGPALALRMRG